MSDERLRFVTAAGLVIGALLGMAGTFAPSAQIRGLAWGADGTVLVMASALARGAPPPERQGAAGGRLPGLSGGRDADRLGLRDGPRGQRALVRCGCRLVGGSPRPQQRGAGVPGARQSDGRHCGRAVRDRSSADVLGARLTALSAPLPFGAYPFLAITLLGWAWRTSGRSRRGTLGRERGTRRSHVRDSAR